MFSSAYDILNYEITLNKLLLAIIPLLLMFIICKCVNWEPPIKNLKDKHVVVTGGSSGIGRAFVLEAARLGAHVTIIGRNPHRLHLTHCQAKQASAWTSQKIQIVSVDVTDYTSLDETLNFVEECMGPIFMLVNCAGLAVCGKIEDLEQPDIDVMTKVNLYGTIYSTKLVAPKMKLRKEGIIVITASQAALIGIYGMSVYSATKFALRGFAEALDMELRPYNVSVTVAYPPDTNTPGYQTENLTKPVETKLISQTSGLYQPDEVAKQIMKDAMKKNFTSYMGLEGFMLSTLCAGMTRFNSLFELTMQIFLMGGFRVISIFFLRSFRNIINKAMYADARNNEFVRDRNNELLKDD